MGPTPPRVLAVAALALVGCKASDHELETLDSVDSELILVSPAAGSWHRAGTVEVEGEAFELDEVSVGDKTMRVDDGRFSGMIALDRGITLVEASATDGAGSELFSRHGVIAGDFVEPSGSIGDAMEVRLNQGGLDTLGRLVGGYLEAATISEAAISLNPVYEDSYGVWGWDAVEISADVVGIDFGTPDIHITPSGGLLELTVTLPQLDVDLNAYGDVVGIDFDVDAELTADDAVISGTLLLDADRGELDIELLDVDIELQGFAYDTSLLPDSVEGWLFVDTARDKIETMLVEKIETMVPELLDEKLAGLDPSFELELLGVPLSVAATFAELDVDNKGLSLLLDFAAEAPEAGTKTYSGVLTTGAVDPAADHSADMGLAISDDLLNRIIFELWAAGLMDMTLTSEEGTLPQGLLDAIGAEGGILTTEATLPPVVVEVDGGLQLQFAEMLIHLESDTGKGATLDFALAGFVDLELGLDGGTIELDLGEPQIILEARDASDGRTDEAVTRVFEEKLPIDSMLLLLGALEFDIPSVLGLEFASAKVDRADDGSHTDIELTLDLEAG